MIGRLRRALGALLLAACGVATAQAPPARDETLRSALQAAEAEPGPDGAALFEALAALGDHLSAGGRAEEALALWQRMLAEAERRAGPDHLLVASTLERLAGAHIALGDPAQALPLFDRSRAILAARQGPQSRSVMISLANQSVALRALGRLDDAAALLDRALEIGEQTLPPDHRDLAGLLLNRAVLAMSQGRSAQALALFERSGAILERQSGAPGIELAMNLLNRATLLDMTGDPAGALALYARGLPILEALRGADSPDVATVLDNQAGALQRVGRLDEALRLRERALGMLERLRGPDHPTLATLLNNIAYLHHLRGDLGRALPLFQRAAALIEARFGPEHPELGAALGNLSMTLLSLGRAADALPLEERALRIAELRLGATHPDVALRLNNLARVHGDLGRHEEALALYRRSLALRELDAAGNPALVLVARNNVAAQLIDLARWDEARAELQRSRALLAGLAGDHTLEEATLLNNEAALEALAGRWEDSVPLFGAAIARADAGATGRDVLWKAQSGLAAVYRRLGRPELAILWGKEAVNTLQGLRAELAGLERGLQASYLQDKRAVYDQLADALIAQGRLFEAQDVLQMLKEQELQEGLQRAEPVDPRRTRIALTGVERERFARYYALRDGQAALAAERLALQQLQAARALTPEEAARLKQIVEVEMPPAAEAMRVFLAQLERDMARTGSVPAQPAGGEASRLRRAVDALAASEPAARAVGLQYLVTDERLSIVLSLPGSPPLAVQQPVGRQALYERITRLLLQLRHPRSDAAVWRAALRELHGWLVAPIEADLRRFGARTLMLSLDDQLRLIPFAALLDERGRHLVQDYTLALYNEAARQALEKPAASRWRVAAMGLSEPVDDLPALAAVPQELEAVVRVRGAGGAAWLNRAFDRARLLGTLDSREYNVLHVASHFVLQPGLPAQSRLYLGDKSRLTLADIAREDLKFSQFDLVTFSACDTARGGGRDATGQEMESLSAKTQNQGAQAVLATLWKVDDASTAAFMRRYYALRGERGLNKAQALREAQLAMLEGRMRAPGRDWGAPYHWAPFVLMGNWR
ncbi:MAG: CHAT domain-containing protein [Piscinibacter sp.]|uniref:CHAT domain-containing tetratricopeptide repeat protein n=1 Tax=Piscinibacter sp. TaxID=1903157 RepID=UPI002584C2DB|nr:CHAT domain-containing tetratricopeptide repeat protein [Piscinibacter sp.]MCW5666698.1 CHAT domain-containing protein [Piscinibacter sp.]